MYRGNAVAVAGGSPPEDRPGVGLAVGVSVGRWVGVKPGVGVSVGGSACPAREEAVILGGFRVKDARCGIGPGRFAGAACTLGGGASSARAKKPAPKSWPLAKINHSRRGRAVG